MIMTHVTLYTTLFSHIDVVKKKYTSAILQDIKGNPPSKTRSCNFPRAV